MSKDVKKNKRCRICFSSQLHKFLDLGQMPIPNGFLKKDKLSKPEKKFPLACFSCKNCGLVNLTHVVNPNLMFKNYAYIPSTARTMINNFNSLVYQTLELSELNKDSLVIDIGSNDGTLLSLFKKRGVRVLGIDPAENIAKIARQNGIATEAKIFNLKTAKSILKKYGKADVITGTNVVAHIDNLHTLFSGVSLLLKKTGLFVTEFPYLVDLITKNQFDTIYHEHLSYFSLKPWAKLVGMHKLEMLDVSRPQVHGGSVRIFHKKRNQAQKKINHTVTYLISLEDNVGLYDKDKLNNFAQKVDSLKKDLRELLASLKSQGKRIVGYGAAAKGNVLTNFYDIGTETLDYIVDSIPQKHGLYTPGKHIPIYPEERLNQDKPDYALILAWNFADEIIGKQKLFKKRGGKFIVPIPKVQII